MTRRCHHHSGRSFLVKVLVGAFWLGLMIKLWYVMVPLVVIVVVFAAVKGTRQGRANVAARHTAAVGSVSQAQ